MKLIVYVKCHNPENGEMRLCLEDDVKSVEIGEALIAREKKRYRDEPGMLERRRYEVEE